jgi:ribonucleoside-triphosphate reductase
LPVNYTDDIFEVLDRQDPLQTRYTGGTVLHVFLGEAAADPQAVKSFVKKVCENYSLPYFTVSPSFSICQTHGYLNGEHPVCPECGSTTEVYARIVGYLRPINQWNEGKQAEFDIRRHYSVDASPAK